MRRAPWRGAVAALGLAGVTAAAADPQAGVPDWTAAERAAIAALGPWPPAPVRDASNRWDGDPRAIALGRRLFFDPSLSASGRLSCASCHVPARGFQDGRQSGPNGRDTPSLWDLGSRRWFGWDGAHDSAWSASLAPLVAPHEFAATPEALARRFAGRDATARQWRALHGPPVADEALLVAVAKTLAAWQATRVSPRTPFDDFRDALQRGDVRAAARYPADAQRGLRLFIGRGRCLACHAGPAFTNGEFADIGLPFFRPGVAVAAPGAVDPGRWGGLEALAASRFTRGGPFSDAPADDPRSVLSRRRVQEPRHYGEFRVPGLRQLLHTAPYGHAGSLPTVEAVVRHYSELDLERIHADGAQLLQPLRLSAAESADLVAFLRSLSTPRGGRSQWAGGAGGAASPAGSSGGDTAGTR